MSGHCSKKKYRWLAFTSDTCSLFPQQKEFKIKARFIFLERNLAIFITNI